MGRVFSVGADQNVIVEDSMFQQERSFCWPDTKKGKVFVAHNIGTGHHERDEGEEKGQNTFQ